jgi:hypothetical protein
MVCPSAAERGRTGTKNARDTDKRHKRMTHPMENLKEANRLKTSRRYVAQPSKAKEHRYERRKVRQTMRHGEWQDETDA